MVTIQGAEIEADAPLRLLPPPHASTFLSRRDLMAVLGDYASSAKQMVLDLALRCPDGIGGVIETTYRFDRSSAVQACPV